ncbi:MAG: ATP-binding cassette domain-containing protein, partial [Muribaculaceae bacterium]|nr:ATP-binding cassette domain-containing protein [Muribaculaceae bacterium]
HTLSGGERARLHLAATLMRSPNFLILDEPTNDLDIVTLGILEDYLADFKGCLIVISHDRFFLDSIVDHLFVFQGNGVIKDFPGNYTEYRQFLAEQQKERVQTEEKQTRQQRPKTDRPAKLSFKEKKELEKLTQEIDELNNEKAEIEQLFNSDADPETIREKADRYKEIQSALDEKELRWLELSEIEG